jgi:outer membrane cobalamin receptor
MGTSSSALRIAFAAAVPLLATAACAPPRATVDPDAPRGEVVTSEQIAATGAGNVWDVLRRTVRSLSYMTGTDGRPMAIRRRGRSSIQTDDQVLVVIDHVRLDDIRLLYSMPPATVERIEVLSGIEATTYFGVNAGDGVIHIITKSR